MLQEIQKLIHTSRDRRPTELIVPDHRVDELAEDLNRVTIEFRGKITGADIRDYGLVLYGIPVRVVAKAA